MSKNLIALALEWIRLDAALKEAKEAESAKRAELVEACFPAGLERGTNGVSLGDGYVVKAVTRPAPKLDTDKVKAAVAKLEALGPVGALLAGRLIKWKPDLSISEFDKLEAKHKRLFEKGAVEIGLSAPSVDVVVPG